MPVPAKPRFFAKPERFGAWLAAHGAKRSELLVGFWKVGSGKPSMTWAQSVEQALIHGWIDGVRRSLGPESYAIRFTPRKRGSNWSVINVRTAKRLIAEGRMAPAGLAAFKASAGKRKRSAAYEQRKPPELGGDDLRRFKQDAVAWAWFKSAPPSYQRACAWYIQSAKKPETRERRLLHIIANARMQRVAPQYRWRKGASGKSK